MVIPGKYAQPGRSLCRKPLNSYKWYKYLVNPVTKMHPYMMYPENNRLPAMEALFRENMLTLRMRFRNFQVCPTHHMCQNLQKNNLFTLHKSWAVWTLVCPYILCFVTFAQDSADTTSQKNVLCQTFTVPPYLSIDLSDSQLNEISCDINIVTVPA